MALAALKTWVAAEVLYAADLNAEFSNIRNNALSLISPLTGSLDVNGNDLTAIDELGLSNAGANASAAGRLRRNAGALTWMDAGSHVHQIGTNWGIGTATFGTNADNVLAFFAGTAATTSPTDTVQTWALDMNGAGTMGLQVRDEAGTVYSLGARAANEGGLRMLTASSAQAVWEIASGDLYVGTKSGGNTYIMAADTAVFSVNGSGNVGVGGVTSWGTNAAKVYAQTSGTAPTTAPADLFQVWSADRNGAGTAAPFIRTEDSGISERLLAVAVQSYDATERTCTNSATDLSTHTVNIPASDGFIVTGLYKRTGSTGAACSLGLKVNGTQIINNFNVSNTDAQDQLGAFSYGLDEGGFGAARDTNYTQSGIFKARMEASGTALSEFTGATYANPLPTAAITEIIVTGNSNNAGQTLAIKHVTVYRVCRS